MCIGLNMKVGSLFFKSVLYGETSLNPWLLPTIILGCAKWRKTGTSLLVKTLLSYSQITGINVQVAGLEGFQTKFKCVCFASPGTLTFWVQVHFHKTHSPLLNLVLDVNFGNRWSEMVFWDHSIFLHSQTHIVIICTQMKLPEPGKCPRVFICHPLLSSWVEFN